jgi:hypothetical protein
VTELHIPHLAANVDPVGDREFFAKRVEELVRFQSSGVYKIIPKGEMNEPVDHVEFTFDVT